jgi:hypothetical protein
MSTWMDISGLIVESSKLYFFKRIIQKSFLWTFSYSNIMDLSNKWK